MSGHHLTSLKASYLKLRHLVDVGCIFVGHGLKKDFRMINMLVPQEQVVDTVDLFYLKRQRKISLRFLAAYLLRQDIQQVTHDSIEDARTALSLYKMYTKLQKEDRVREVLENMYAWGKQHAWDPAALKDHPHEAVDLRA
jgi:PAB-dependent poly(A)-specific ribonuclease subunit 2